LPVIKKILNDDLAILKSQKNKLLNEVKTLSTAVSDIKEKQDRLVSGLDKLESEHKAYLRRLSDAFQEKVSSKTEQLKRREGDLVQKEGF